MIASKQFETTVLELLDTLLSEKETIAKLERENEYLLAALVEIEEGIDHNLIDCQLISSGIKRLRNQIQTGVIHNQKIEKGLVR